MARNNRGAKQRGRSRNNNPTGRNQYSGDVMDMARERPLAAAAVAAGAAARGRVPVVEAATRSAISSATSRDQISEWRKEWAQAAKARRDSRATASSQASSRQSGMSETGGGNASLGARSGGGGSPAAPAAAAVQSPPRRAVTS